MIGFSVFFNPGKYSVNNYTIRYKTLINMYL